MNVALLLNGENTGIMQKLGPVENEIFRKTAEMTAAMQARESSRRRQFWDH
jgi:hypothetical protein